KEARRRGNSVYFPDRVVPMLPEVLSADVCSLRAGEDRAAMACHLKIDSHGRVRDWSFTRALVRIAEVIAYEDAQARIDAAEGKHHPPTPSSNEEGESVARGRKAPSSSEEGESVARGRKAPSSSEEGESVARGRKAPSSSEEGGGGGAVPTEILQNLWSAWRALYKAREARDPLELELPERRVMLDEKGRIAEIAIRERLDAHRVVEDFMIAANVAAAKALESKAS